MKMLRKTNVWMSLLVNCIIGELHSDDCFVRDTNGWPLYNGTINTTSTGKACQRWDQIIPHIPLYPMSSEHENYCRNPDNDTMLWCYTMDLIVDWEFCNISECDKSTTIIATAEIQQTTLQTTFDSSTNKQLTEMITVSQPTTPVNMSNQCICPCGEKTWYWIQFLQSNLTDEEKNLILDAEKERIRQTLLIKKSALTSYKRARTSIADDRPSATSIGVLGIVVMSTVCIVIVSMDCLTCCHKCLKIKK